MVNSPPPMPGALNPTLARLLGLCRLDRRWARGQGAWLFDEAGRWFLDAYAQYGAVILGHNAPAPVAALRAALDAGEPAMVQPYPAPHAQALARELAALAPGGLDRVVFTNTGAETVEAGVRLVRTRSGRPLVIAAQGAYHGRTLGTLSLAGSRHATGFGPLAPGFLQVPFGDAAALAAALEAHPGQVAGVVLEPIQGERGVHLPPEGYLGEVRRLCSAHGAALVLDEIQTGLGRTGRLFACQHEGVDPDVLLVAKGLSGGLLPIGAVLCGPAWWDPRFGLAHSSTFANNNLACAVGRAVLRELVERELPARAARLGERLQERLRSLARRHPRWIAAVRGRGLLGAIELRAPEEREGAFLAVLQNHGAWAYAMAGVVARCASVLVAPTLGESPVLRIAPPLVVSEAELDLLLTGIEGVFAALEREGLRLVLAALGDAPRPCAEPRQDGPRVEVGEAALPRPRARTRVDYAFLAHLTRPEELLLTNPGLQLSSQELGEMCRVVGELPPVLMCHGPTLRSPAGPSAEGVVIMLPYLPDDLVRAGARETCRRIGEAVDMAAGLGARVVGLGGHTTPFSRHGHAVQGRGPRVTTGNALTAGAAVAAVLTRLARRGLELEETPIAILGAGGSVAGLCARLLARAGATRLLLVGRPGASLAPLERVRAALAAPGAAGLPGLTVELADGLDRLDEARVVLAATTTRGALDGAPLAPGTLVCDLGRPPDASEALRARPDLELFEGGLVRLPDPAASFGPGNLVGLPPGVQLACLAETVVLALEGGAGPDHVGRDLPLETVDAVLALAARHGFAPLLEDGAPALLLPERALAAAER